MSKLNKSQLRQAILKERQSLSQLQWQEQSKQICDRLVASSLFTEAQTILAYFSFRQEPDLTSLFLSTFNKKYAFPRCLNKSLIWHLWQPGEKLQIGKYGIKEPAQSAPMIAPQSVDLILVPAVACDQQGYRLGYGGGFYDRLLSSSELFNISAVGIVFNYAYLAQLPTDNWDIKLNYICTEHTLDLVLKV